MEQAHLDEGARHPTLGPHYFAARDAVEKFMAKFEADHFEPLLKKFSEKFYEKLLEDVQTYLMSNAESNLQGELWRGIDESIKYLLSGEPWAIERYALAKYNGEAVRAAIAKHIPTELQNARIADLETENKRLREQLEWARR